MAQTFKLVTIVPGRDPEVHCYDDNLSIIELASSNLSGLYFRLTTGLRVITVGNYSTLEEIEIKVVAKALSKELSSESVKNLSKAEKPSGEYTILINCDRGEYMDLNEYYSENFWGLDPIIMLTALGNGRSSSDYNGLDEDMVGRWAGNYIQLAREEDVTLKHLAKLNLRFEV